MPSMNEVNILMRKLKQVGFDWVQLNEESGCIILPGFLKIEYDAQTFACFWLYYRDIDNKTYKLEYGCKGAEDDLVLAAWNRYMYRKGKEALEKEPTPDLDALYEGNMKGADSGLRPVHAGFINGKPTFTMEKPSK